MKAIALILFLSAVMFTSYHFTMVAEPLETIERHTVQHAAIVDHTAASPYRYRVLMPYAAEALATALPYQPYAARVLMAYSLLHMLILPLSMLALYSYVSSVTDGVGGLMAAGIYFVAWPVIMVGVYHTFLIWAPVEMLLLCVALRNTHRLKLFVVIMLIAILNRETGALLALCYLAAHGLRRNSILMLLGAGAAVFGLRALFGDAPHASTASISTRGGLDALFSQVIVFNLLFLPLWIASIRGYKATTRDLRRVALVSIVYAALLLWFANLREVRLLLTLYPLVMPLAVQYVLDKTRHIDSKPATPDDLRWLLEQKHLFDNVEIRNN